MVICVCLGRIKAQNMTVMRFSGAVARYVMIIHSSDAGNPFNTKRYNTLWTENITFHVAVKLFYS